MSLQNFLSSFREDSPKETVGVGHVKAGLMVAAIISAAMSTSALANEQANIQAPCFDANQTELMQDASLTSDSSSRVFRSNHELAQKDPVLFNPELFGNKRSVTPAEAAPEVAMEACKDQAPVERRLRAEFTTGASAAHDTPADAPLIQREARLSTASTMLFSEENNDLLDVINVGQQVRSLNVPPVVERSLQDGVGQPKERSINLSDAFQGTDFKVPQRGSLNLGGAALELLSDTHQSTDKEYSSTIQTTQAATKTYSPSM